MKRVELAGPAGFWEALQRVPESNLYPQAASIVRFEGSCPYLFCLVTEAHGHPVCEACGAVRYGNAIYCGRCSEVRELDLNPTVPISEVST